MITDWQRIPRVILGLPFDDVDFEQTLDWAVQRMRSGRPGYIATVNVDFVMQAWRDPELQRILIEADMVVADGQPIVALSKLLGPSLRERVTGSDLTPMLAERCRDEGLSIYGLGGAPGVAETALDRLNQRYPGLRVAGHHSPPKAELLDMEQGEILEELEKAEPDLLLVAFGAPKQEKFINMNLQSWKVPLAIGIGGTLDFISGTQTRAPRWVQRLSMEWLWRMLSDPKRLFKRYALNLVFLAFVTIRLFWLKHLYARPVSKENLEQRQNSSMLSGMLRYSQDLRHLDAKSCIGHDPLQLEVFGTLFDGPVPPSTVLDLQGYDWLDSHQLGQLLQLSRYCRHRGGRLYLVHLADRLAKLLTIYRLDLYLSISTDLDEVIQSQFRLRKVPVSLYASLPVEITGVNVNAFFDPIEAKLTSASYDRVIFDARDLEYLDSTALAKLSAFIRRVESQGMELNVIHLKELASQILDRAKLKSQPHPQDRHRTQKRSSIKSALGGGTLSSVLHYIS